MKKKPKNRSDIVQEIIAESHLPNKKYKDETTDEYCCLNCKNVHYDLVGLTGNVNDGYFICTIKDQLNENDIKKNKCNRFECANLTKKDLERLKTFFSL